MQYIFDPILRLFANIPEIILLNIFLIIATYTDCKSMKIYNKFNLTMLITRALFFVVLAFFFKDQISIGYVVDCIFGALILCFAFWIPAAIAGDSIGGDIKFAFNLGLWCGSIPALFLALIGTILNLGFRLVFGDKDKKEIHSKKIGNYGHVFFKATGRVPLAPFFYAGYIVLFAIHFFLPVA